jgi:hypothetical protein
MGNAAGYTNSLLPLVRHQDGLTPEPTKTSRKESAD